MSHDLPYWLGIVRFRKFGARSVARLLSSFKLMQHVFEADVALLVQAGIKPKIATAFVLERQHIDPHAELASLQKEGLHAIPCNDPAYPALLNTIYDPPPVLFVRGHLPKTTRPHVAIVGSRACTSYGARVVKELCRVVANMQGVVVSGLAQGIDGYAHQGAMEHGSPTIAVIASGLDSHLIYPAHHRALARNIVESGGAIVSEFPLGTHPLRQHFPFRNRVIAGLCQTTVVVEAAEKSGSLITAQCALESGRDVYSVPGSIFSQASCGTHKLLKEGATPLTSPEDILETFGLGKTKTEHKTPTQTRLFEPQDATQRRLWQVLEHEPKHIDDLAREVQLPTQLVNQALSFLEIEGVITRLEGPTFAKRGDIP